MELKPRPWPHEVSAYAVDIQLLQTKQQHKYKFYSIYIILYFIPFIFSYFIYVYQPRGHLCKTKISPVGQQGGGQGKGTRAVASPATTLEPPMYMYNVCFSFLRYNFFPARTTPGEFLCVYIPTYKLLKKCRFALMRIFPRLRYSSTRLYYYLYYITAVMLSTFSCIKRPASKYICFFRYVTMVCNS